MVHAMGFVFNMIGAAFCIYRSIKYKEDLIPSSWGFIICGTIWAATA